MTNKTNLVVKKHSFVVYKGSLEIELTFWKRTKVLLSLNESMTVTKLSEAGQKRGINSAAWLPCLLGIYIFWAGRRMGAVFAKVEVVNECHTNHRRRGHRSDGT
jgi:hypothetical protein